MTTDFTSLNLREELVQAITELGYSEPTPIQAAIIPLMLKGADVSIDCATTCFFPKSIKIASVSSFAGST